MTAPQRMVARFNSGRCCSCRQPIAVGQAVLVTRAHPRNQYRHERCYVEASPADQAALRVRVLAGLDALERHAWNPLGRCDCGGTPDDYRYAACPVHSP